MNTRRCDFFSDYSVIADSGHFLGIVFVLFYTWGDLVRNELIDVYIHIVPSTVILMMMFCSKIGIWICQKLWFTM